MAAVIALRPETEHGEEILDELERRTEVRPMQVIDDGTRRYYLDSVDADVDAFDSMLFQIDTGWREHITNWRN